MSLCGSSRDTELGHCYYTSNMASLGELSVDGSSSTDLQSPYSMSRAKYVDTKPTLLTTVPHPKILPR